MPARVPPSGSAWSSTRWHISFSAYWETVQGTTDIDDEGNWIFQNHGALVASFGSYVINRMFDYLSLTSLVYSTYYK